MVIRVVCKSCGFISYLGSLEPLDADFLKKYECFYCGKPNTSEAEEAK
jgi:hypothetical protein